MCNLYSITRSPEAVRRLFRVAHNRSAAFEPLPAIFPGHHAPVVRKAADGERETAMLSWGFVLAQEGRAPKRVTNVRDDKVFTSPFWRDSFERRRCLVPASSFCEPKGERPATWHWFALRGEEPRPLFAFPGIWRRWKGPLKSGAPSVELDVFSFMTTLPNALVATVNHERMPVLLSDEAQFETWLSGSPQEAFALVRSFDPDAMRIVQAGAERQDLLAGAS
ncbi:MAG: SOS response-associated peptidase family protein [Hyphomicrobiaceae bacterium]|nr:SOS response-associated peptidase family protein [Hyphomicrobiaceae bacterium]